MSLQSLVLTIISDITDPATRMDISSTIFFLRDLYFSGRISQEELRKELTSVVDTVFKAVHPEWLPDERKAKVKEIVDQLVRAITLSAVKTHLFSKFSGQPREELGQPF